MACGKPCNLPQLSAFPGLRGPYRRDIRRLNHHLLHLASFDQKSLFWIYSCCSSLASLSTLIGIVIMAITAQGGDDISMAYGPSGIKGLIREPHIVALGCLASVGGVLFGYAADHCD